jgi:RNA polymerase sigma-70 factor (ECF subfamily)
LNVAFHQQIEKHRPSLVRYSKALLRTCTIDQQEDLVADTFERALTKEHLFRRGTDLRAWLFTIMHNNYVNGVRRSVRVSKYAFYGTPKSLENVTDNKGDRQNGALTLRDLKRCLDMLPNEQKEIVLMIGLEGLSYNDIAAKLNIPVGTVRSRLSRGRFLLRKLMSV